ncbi:MAG: hypothetical protein WCG98_04030 [bacterium]
MGAVVSIRFTVAVLFQVLPARSANSKINIPSPVKVYHVNPELFVIVPVSFKVIVATTFPLVILHDAGRYVIVPTGGVVSGATGVARTYRLACRPVNST